MTKDKEKCLIDSQLKILIDNCYTCGHRSLLFVHHANDLQSKGAGEQVMLIHHLLCKRFKERPSILWCHKKNGETPKVSKSVLKKLEKNIKSGKCTVSSENAFQVFLLSTQVTFCNFSEIQKCLGKTYGLCVIQDFDGLTPNVLCRAVETVCGGGIIVFLLPKRVKNMRDLFNQTMEVHSRLKTHSHPKVEYRFNERFVLSIGQCKTAMILDWQLKACKELVSQKTLEPLSQSLKKNTEEEGLEELRLSLEDTAMPLPQLTQLCRTLDQAKAVLKMIDVITDKNGRSTVAISASRGRGKSSAMGLATAAAVYFGVNNIYVTSPSPENLTTFFEFLFKGFDVLNFEEKKHYNIIQSSNPEFNNAIIRVNVFTQHRQVIQYICPSDSQKVNQAELIIIDEAATIPLPYVKALIGFNNVFMASTINGYEGTGRSLSLKLLKDLRQQSVPFGVTATSSAEDSALSNSRPLFELTLETSIRYKPNDPVEKWLNQLLCLEATSSILPVSHCPHADTCQLYYVNRDVLLSGHPTTEDFLHQVLSLLVSSHYRNSPDDLQMLADAASHHLFVLLPQLQSHQQALPPIFSVVQVSLEGGIPSKVSGPHLLRGEAPEGDLIPWSLASLFLNPKLTKFRGLRIVRIATHPHYQSMGYGSRAISLLKDYYLGRFQSLDEEERETLPRETDTHNGSHDSELIGPRTVNDPLLMKLSERNPEPLDYIGVSFGITGQLFKFWKKLSFLPLHLSQNTNKTTGEHNCIMVYPVMEEPFAPSSNQINLPGWLKSPVHDFISSFVSLLAGPFSGLSPQLAHSILALYKAILTPSEIDWSDLEYLMSGHDVYRIESYCLNLSDRHLIADLMPPIASLFFNEQLPTVHLSSTQSEILLGCGLQMMPIEEVAKRLDLPIESALGQLNRAMKRLLKAVSEVQEKGVAKHLPKQILEEDFFKPVTISLEHDLDQPMQSETNLKELKEFAIKGDAEEWDRVLKQDGASTDVVTVKSLKRPARLTESQFENELKLAQKSSSGKRKKKQKRK